MSDIAAKLVGLRIHCILAFCRKTDDDSRTENARDHNDYDELD
jgi:hypothetical protein